MFSEKNKRKNFRERTKTSILKNTKTIKRPAEELTIEAKISDLEMASRRIYAE